MWEEKSLLIEASRKSPINVEKAFTHMQVARVPFFTERFIVIEKYKYTDEHTHTRIIL